MTCRYIRLAPMPGELPDLVHDLGWRAGQAVVPQVGRVPADGRRPPGQLGLVPAAAHVWAAE